ncbi:MAG: efflux RND transporter periplasmic adaptor subunit [Bacteroidota bacterium]|nr:efflux RND transporter periplasmic adaptor subunit [Bacteroidota bacterium]
MKNNLCFFCILFLSCIAGRVVAQDDHGHSHEEVVSDVSGSAPGIFTIYAESQKYELTLKHKKINPSQQTQMDLYIADYVSNHPIVATDIKVAIQEDTSVNIVIENHEPGVYHLTGKFPEVKSYSLAVTLNSAMNGPDLLLLKNVEVGKEPPVKDEAADIIVAAKEGSDWWKFLLVFIGGLGIGFLVLRRRPKVAMVLLVLISIPAIFQQADAHGDTPHGDEKAGTAGNSVFIPKETQFLFDILTDKVGVGDFQPSVELFGTVVTAPAGFAEITTSQSGKLQSLKVTPGQKVSVGQVLAVIIPSTTQADQVGVITETGRLRADIRNAQAELAAAEKELNRLRSIADIAAKKDVQAAEARYNTAKANLEALQGISSGSVTSGSGSITLKAPVSGTIGQFSLSSGAEVIAGNTLFTITNLSKVYVEAQVYDRDADIVKNAQKYTVTCTNDDQHKTTEVRLVSAALEVNPSNQSQKVLFELLNPEGEFKIGEFVTLQAFKQKSDKTIFVPNSALSEISGKPVIFIKDGPETYTISYLSLGDDNGTHSVVLKGIEEGERYVIAGTYQVKMMMLNQ